MIGHCHELERMWNEAFMAYHSCIYLEELKEKKKTPRRDSLCLGGDSNRELSEYISEVLPLELAWSVILLRNERNFAISYPDSFIMEYFRIFSLSS
jgi:hypothetical protein